MKERWKTVEGFPHYMVSTYGNVKTKRKVVTVTNSRGTTFKQVYQSHPVQVTMQGNRMAFGLVDDNGKIFYSTLKYVVARNFLPNPENLNTVYNKDGNEENCRLDNLMWCSRSEYLKMKKKK